MEATVVFENAAPPARGTAAAILAALASSPRVPVEWVDELERLIAEGHGGSSQSPNASEG